MTNLTPETIPFLEDSQQIDLNILSKDENNVLVIKDLPFALYEVLGEEITQKKLKKLLKIHKIEYETARKDYKPEMAFILTQADDDSRESIGKI